MDHDPVTGRTIWWRFDPGTDNMIIRVDQDVTDTIRTNEAERNATAGQRFGEWRKVASVPLNHFIQQGLADANKQHDDKYLSKWLNDGDNRAFRTFEGKV